MGKQKVKSKRGQVRLYNTLSKFEWVSQEEWKILVNRVIPQLLSVDVEIKGKKTVLSVDLQNMLPLADYLKSGLSPDNVLTFIWKTEKIARECERHGLRIESLCWDEKLIYVEQSHGEICMVYWPAINLDQNTDPALNFYRGFIEAMKNSGVRQDILAEYTAYFYQRDMFDLQAFNATVNSISRKWKGTSEKKENRQDKPKPEPHKLHSAELNLFACLKNDREQIVLQDTVTVFGRDKTACDVVLKPDACISRRHAMISREGETYYLSDMGSFNGTYLNDKKLKAGRPVALAEGAIIRFGKTSYVFYVTKIQPTTFIH